MSFLPAQVIQLKTVWDKLRPEGLHIQERYHTGKKEDVTLLHLGETINIATCPEQGPEKFAKMVLESAEDICSTLRTVDKEDGTQEIE